MSLPSYDTGKKIESAIMRDARDLKKFHGSDAFGNAPAIPPEAVGAHQLVWAIPAGRLSQDQFLGLVRARARLQSNDFWVTFVALR